MKELKIILIGIAMIIGSWLAITTIRATLAHYAMENLKNTTNQALENMTKRSLENNERMKRDFQARIQKDAEVKKQETIEKEKRAKENSNECKFWRLQSKNRPTEKTERKIKEYCSQP